MVLILVAACKSSAPAPTTSPPATSSSGAKLAAGPVKDGCFAWSASTKALACVVGSRIDGKPAKIGVSFLGGGGSPVSFSDPVGEPTASAVSATLAKEGFEPITGDVQSLTVGTPLQVGAATLVWETKPGMNIVNATCGDKSGEVVSNSGENRTAAVTARAVGDHVVVEMTVTLTGEGATGKVLYASVLDATSCEAIEAAL